MLIQDSLPYEPSPRYLTKEEIADPMKVISDFCMVDGIQEARRDLWIILKVMVTGDYCKNLTRQERSDLLYFYEHLMKCIEAVHLLNEKNQEKIDK